MNGKKTSSKTMRLELNSKQSQTIILQACAILISVTVGYFIWLYAIVDKEQQLMDQLSQKNMRHQQQALQKHLMSVSAKITRHSHSEQLSSALLSNNASVLGNYQKRLMKDIEGLQSVRFFGLNQARRERGSAPVNFVIIDMINRSEKGELVYPEMMRQTKEKAWFIAIVAPVFDQTQYRAQQQTQTTGQIIRQPSLSGQTGATDAEIVGTVYLTISIEPLQQLLSALDPKLGQTRLLQRVTDRELIPFLSIGSAGNYPARQVEITNSNWQLRYIPSINSYLQVKQPQIPVVIVIVSIALLLMALCWYATRMLNRRPEASTVPAPNNNSLNTKVKDPGTPKAVVIDSSRDANSLLDLELSEEDQSLLSFDSNGQIDGREEAATPSQGKKHSVPDSIFRAYDIRGIVDEQLTCELATMIGQAFASEVLDKGDNAMFIGRDGRTHSVKIADAFTRGVLSTGCNVIDLGLAPTPLMNFATLNSEKSSSGAMITASHNPKEYNGFKFVIKGRTLVDQDMQAIKSSIVSGNFHTGQGGTESQNITQNYVDRVFSDVALAGNLHVVIDAANGTTSTIAPALFEELGCTVTPLFCEIDGNFPNHDPDPSVVENLQPLISKVKQVNADLGLAFDGDGDRLVVVTPAGRIIWPDQLMILFAQDVLSRNPGCDIIYDVKSTRQLSQMITRCGGRPIMWKTGHAHMKTKMHDTGALLAGEYSGHIFFKERWFGFDDGMYVAARLLEIITSETRGIDAVFSEWPSLITTPEIKIPVGEEEKFTIVESLLATGDFANGKKTTIDGLRVDFGRGWGLIRASNTSAALTLRFEAMTAADMEKLKLLFKRELKKVDAKLSTAF